MTGEMILSASALLGGCLTGFVPAAGWPGIVFAAGAGAVVGGIAAVFAMRVSAGRKYPPAALPEPGQSRSRILQDTCDAVGIVPFRCDSGGRAVEVSGAEGFWAVPERALRFRSRSGSFPKMSLRSWPDGRSCSAEKERKFFSNTAPTAPAAADILRCGSGARRTGTAAAPASSAR